MLELIDTFFINCPFAPVGLALLTELINADKFSNKSSSLKLALPTPACIIPAFSTLNSTCPLFIAFTAGLYIHGN